MLVFIIIINFKYISLRNISFLCIVRVDYNKTSDLIMNGLLGYLGIKETFPPTLQHLWNWDTSIIGGIPAFCYNLFNGLFSSLVLHKIMIHIAISIVLDSMRECNYQKVGMQIQPCDTSRFYNWKWTDSILYKIHPNDGSFVSSTYLISSTLTLEGND